MPERQQRCASAPLAAIALTSCEARTAGHDENRSRDAWLRNAEAESRPTLLLLPSQQSDHAKCWARLSSKSGTNLGCMHAPSAQRVKKEMRNVLENTKEISGTEVTYRKVPCPG